MARSINNGRGEAFKNQPRDTDASGCAVISKKTFYSIPERRNVFIEGFNRPLLCCTASTLHATSKRAYSSEYITKRDR
jgi:hypothetical protein